MIKTPTAEIDVNKFIRVFDARIAEKIGLNEAIVLNQIMYWLSIFSKENNKQHERDGRVWVFETYEEWHEQFPCFSTRTIRRTMDNLCKIGVVIATEKYNKWKNDHTKWYTIDYELLQKIVEDDSWCGQNGHIDVDKVDRRHGQNDHIVMDKMDRALPNTSTNNTTIDFNTKTSNNNDDCDKRNAPSVSDAQNDKILFGMVRKVFFKNLDVYSNELTIELVYDLIKEFLRLRSIYKVEKYYPSYDEIEKFVGNLSDAIFILDESGATITKPSLMRMIWKFFDLKALDRKSILKLNQLEQNMMLASFVESEQPECYGEIYKGFEYGF